MLFDHFFCQHTLLKSNFGLITHCKRPTHQHLAKLLHTASTGLTLHERWKWTMSAKARAKAHSLDLWPRSQRSSLPSALSQAVCWVTAFRNPPRKPGNLAPTFLEDRTVQIYSINIPLTPHYIFTGGTRHMLEEGTDAVIMAVVLIVLWSSLANKLKGDGMWGVEVTQQKIWSLFILQAEKLSFLVWAQQLPQTEGTFEIPLVKMTKLSHSNSTQLWTFNLATLSAMKRSSAVEVMRDLNVPVLVAKAVSKQECSACRGYLLLTRKLHNRTESRTVTFLLSTSASGWKMFQSNQNTKHLQICTRREHCGRLHSNITMWSLAGFLLGLLHAIQTVTHLYSATGWSWLNYYNVTILPRIVSQD